MDDGRGDDDLTANGKITEPGGPAWGEKTIKFPQLALGGGYELVLIVSNQTDSDWRGQAILRRGKHQPWSEPWALDGVDRTSPDFDIRLDPRATRKFTLTGSNRISSGYLALLPENGSSSRGVAVSFLYNFLIDDQLVDSTGTPAAFPARKFTFPVEKSHTVDTGFAYTIFAPSEAFDIVLSLFDEAGNLVQQKTRSYQGHLARFFTQVFDNLPEGFWGSMVIEAEKPLYLVVLRLEQNGDGFQLTSIPPDAQRPRGLFGEINFPQLALGGGYELLLIVSNKTDREWKGRALLNQGQHDPWSAPWAVDGADYSGFSEFDITLAPQGTQKFVLTGTDQVHTGYLSVRSQLRSFSQDVVVSFFYNFSSNGQLADSTGTPSSRSATKFGFPVEKTTTVDTGFAYTANPLGETLEITLDLFDQEGTLVQQKTLTYEGHRARFFSQVFDDVPEGFVGSVVMESETPFSLVVLRLELTSGGFQLTSVPPDAVTP